MKHTNEKSVVGLTLLEKLLAILRKNDLHTPKIHSKLDSVITRLHLLFDIVKLLH